MPAICFQGISEWGSLMLSGMFFVASPIINLEL
jgi:hypothetical protein